LLPENHYLVCDLFAGAGGLSEGMRQAGFKIAVANEFDANAAKTYRLNHPETLLIEGDITLKETKDAICACFAEKPCDMLVGGCPCPDFSGAGRRKGFKSARGRLIFDYLEMVRRLTPRMAIIENVPGLLTHHDALKAILSIFNYLGYHAETKELNAADFGVPQIRKRLFFVATRRDWRHDPIIWPEPQFAPANEGNSNP
jgi:DNA (cytosine-5)-methyltransferase 1